MSKEKPKVQLEDLFEVDLSKLKTDTVIPFDCFIHLKLNNKIIWWLREGDVLTGERREKLTKLIDPNLYTRKVQEKVFQKYTEDPEVFRVKMLSEKDTKFTVSGGKEESEEMIPVFGSKEGFTSKNIFVGGGSLDPQKNIKVTAKPRFKIDVEFINSVITSIIDVFQGEFSIRVTSKPAARRKAGAKGPLQVDVASFVGLTSQAIRGTVGLCFPMETYLYFLREATGINYREPLPEYCVGCAEFMNSIFTQAYPKLVALGYQIDQAVPILVVGKNIAIPMIIPDPGFSIVFESAGGPFQFEVGIKTGA